LRVFKKWILLAQLGQREVKQVGDFYLQCSGNSEYRANGGIHFPPLNPPDLSGVNFTLKREFFLRPVPLESLRSDALSKEFDCLLIFNAYHSAKNQE